MTKMQSTTTDRPASYRRRPPKGWRTGFDGDLACPHRDISVCPQCLADNPEAVDVHGAAYWFDNKAEADEMREQVAATAAKWSEQ